MYETYIGKTIGNHIHGLKKKDCMIILLGGKVEYQRENSPFMFLIAIK